MKRILLPVLFLAAAGLAANGCDREDSAVGPKSEPAGIGRDVAKAPSDSSATTSKAGESSGSGVTQSGKDTSVGSTSAGLLEPIGPSIRTLLIFTSVGHCKRSAPV